MFEGGSGEYVVFWWKRVILLFILVYLRGKWDGSIRDWKIDLFVVCYIGIILLYFFVCDIDLFVIDFIYWCLLFIINFFWSFVYFMNCMCLNFVV